MKASGKAGNQVSSSLSYLFEQQRSTWAEKWAVFFQAAWMQVPLYSSRGVLCFDTARGNS